MLFLFSCDNTSCNNKVWLPTIFYRENHFLEARPIVLELWLIVIHSSHWLSCRGIKALRRLQSVIVIWSQVHLVVCWLSFSRWRPVKCSCHKSFIGLGRHYWKIIRSHCGEFIFTVSMTLLLFRSYFFYQSCRI